ncbi:MAG: cobalamin biosynthesis protein CobD [Deltaproteobacteria bacterium]|nr:cobalamin biosynthesis protein CobD [Deltaproteobacteria bacterium]
MSIDMMVVFLLALAADFCFGDDLTGRYHPVIAIGRLIELLERRLYPPERDSGRELRNGAYLTVLVVTATGLGIALLLVLGQALGSLVYYPLRFFLLYALLACGGLAREAIRVIEILENEGLEEGRRALSGIVGRETGKLQEDDIFRAVIETVAENLSDGVIAPLFYFMIGGLPLAWAYKAVNTLDSMLGYKNDRYLYFGRFAARLDDFLNFIPARISALLILLAAVLQGLDPLSGWRVLCRDRRAHSSPNSGWPEAAMAGILGIRLGGDNYYHGKLVRKPYIGDNRETVSREAVFMAVTNLYLSSAIFAALITVGFLFF